jgi:hypothetical protein
MRTQLKTFLATFCALIAAMAIGFGFWKHEQWVAAKTQCLSTIHNAYQVGLNANGGLDSQIEAMHNSEAVAAIAAENLLALFRAKILPLSVSDRKDQAIAQKIVAKAEFRREWQGIVLKINSASSTDECERGVHELTALCEKYGELGKDARQLIAIIAEDCPPKSVHDSRSYLSSPTQPKTPPPHAAPADQQTELAEAVSDAKPPPSFVTLTQSVSINGSVLPIGTRLDVVFKQGSDLHIRYAGAEYVITVSATDLK